MPYILHAFRHPIYGIRCIYSLFNPVAVILGPDESRKQLLTLIQSALNPEKMTIYHWRCFTRRFLIQLIARFGLMKFLQIFPILLIEVCSGFKDEIYLKTAPDDKNNIMIDSNLKAEDTICTERTNTITSQDYETNIFEVKVLILSFFLSFPYHSRMMNNMIQIYYQIQLLKVLLIYN